MSTLPSTILTDFKAQIEAITPAESRQGARGFVFVKSRGDVEGAELRTFTLEIEPVGDGVIVGCGNDYHFNLAVVTSYAGLSLYDAQSLVVEDNRQIFQTLAFRSGPLSGLQAVFWQEPGFTFADKDDGKVWGSHVFLVRYIAGNTP